jgi:hypothetical protein
MGPDWEKEYQMDGEEAEDDDFDLGQAEHDANPEVNHQERLKEAKRDMKKQGKFANEQDVEDFVNKYDDVGGKSFANAEGNLLHAIIEMVKHSDDNVKSQDVELLVRRMVRKWPSLIKDVNNDGYNPVFMAVKTPPHQLAGYMISACEDAECLDSALSAQALEGKTCLHVAFQKDIDPGTTRMLVKRASDDVLAVQDNLGNTPMRRSDPCCLSSFQVSLGDQHLCSPKTPDPLS